MFVRRSHLFSGTVLAALGLLAGATACTAILGVEDVPFPADGSAGGSTSGTTGGTTSSGTTGGTTSSSSGNPDAGLGPDPVANYVNAQCAHLKACWGPRFDYSFVSDDECINGLRQVVEQVLSFEGAPKLEILNECAVKLRAARQSNSCDFLECPRFTGELVDGAPCVAHEQCQSGVCQPGETLCGVCAKAPDEGQACINESCGPARTCVFTANGFTCHVQRKLGEPCDENTPCADGLGCGTQEANKCGPAFRTQGASCNAIAPCDGREGLQCINVAGNPTCHRIYTVGVGEICGLTDAPSEAKLCNRVGCDTNVDSRCDAPPKEGDSCALSDCVLPARCFNNVCTRLPDPNTCGNP